MNSNSITSVQIATFRACRIFRAIVVGVVLISTAAMAQEVRSISFEEALQIAIPEPFDQWLVGGMGRFEVNVRYLFERFGGELPEET